MLLLISTLSMHHLETIPIEIAHPCPVDDFHNKSRYGVSRLYAVPELNILT
jgi:hypothetical protein